MSCGSTVLVECWTTVFCVCFRRESRRKDRPCEYTPIFNCSNSFSRLQRIGATLVVVVMMLLMLLMIYLVDSAHNATSTLQLRTGIAINAERVHPRYNHDIESFTRRTCSNRKIVIPAEYIKFRPTCNCRTGPRMCTVMSVTNVSSPIAPTATSATPVWFEDFYIHSA